MFQFFAVDMGKFWPLLLINSLGHSGVSLLRVDLVG